MRFTGKIAVVTGSSAGIGREIVLQLAREGGSVVVNGRNEEEVGRVVAEIEALGASAVGCTADVTRRDEVERLAATALASFGRIDILVNNAGGSSGSRYLEEIGEEDWDRVMDVNLKSVFLCTRAVIPSMKERRYGKIVTVASQAGRALSTLAGSSYAGAKAGAIAFTRHVAHEYAPFGINANSVAPGVVYSGPRIERIWKDKPQEERDRIMEGIPLGRLAGNEDVAAAVLFLACDESSYVTGATIDVNGGRWML